MKPLPATKRNAKKNHAYAIPSVIIVFDIETNGRSFNEDRILEIYALAINLTGTKPRFKSFHRTVKIEENNVDLFIQLTRGWTNEYLNKNGVYPQDAINEFVGFINRETLKIPPSDYLLVGYNTIQFDNKFLKKYFREYRIEMELDSVTFDCFLENKAIVLGIRSGEYIKDWRKLHKRMLNNDYSRPLAEIGANTEGLSLRDACIRNGIDFSVNNAHHAQYDTIKCLQLLIQQKPAWFIKHKTAITSHIKKLLAK